jgi:hypothetical protein
MRTAGSSNLEVTEGTHTPTAAGGNATDRSVMSLGQMSLRSTRSLDVCVAYALLG